MAPGADRPPDPRDRHLRRLRRFDLLLRALLFAPTALLLPTGLLLDHVSGDRHNPLLVLLYAVLLAVFLHLFGLGTTMRDWSTWSLLYRRSVSQLKPVDWADPRWALVRAAVERAGVEPERVRAVAAFTDFGSVRTIHEPGRPEGRLSDLNDRITGLYLRWGERRVLLVGAAGGIALAVLNDSFPGWYRVPSWSVSAVAVLLLVPVAVRRGLAQYRLNVTSPQHLIVVPRRWRLELRREPARGAVFLHELSHVLHRDAARRRMLGPRVTVARLAIFLDAAAPGVLGIGETPALLLGLAVLGCGYVGTRMVRCAVPLLQELRADAEACHDEDARAYLQTFVTTAQGHHASTRQDVRLRALASGWHDLGTRAFHRAALVLCTGFLLPVLLAQFALWTGLVAPAPDLDW